MAINVSARKYRLLVGNEDYSSALLEAKLDTTELNQSGFVSTGGSLTLIDVRGLPGSLDDRKNLTSWRIGQSITIDVTNESGVLERMPVGALRVISSEFDAEARRLQLRVGCLLTLLSFKQPTEPLEGQDPEIISSPNNSRLDIVQRLLAKAGITNISCPYNIPYPISYPIEPSGSYIETAGRILYSAGYLGWCDRNEIIQIKPVSLSGTPSTTLQIGSDKGDELWYRRLSSSEGLREIIKVVGSKKLAQYPTDFFTVAVKYGTAKSVDPETTSNSTIIVEIREINSSISGNTITTITLVSRSAGLIFSDLTSGRFNLIVAERIVEVKTFDADKKGKLRSIRSNSFRPIGSVLAEYFKALEENGTNPGSKRLLILAARTEINYQYDIKERPTVIDTIKYETKGALLSGINQDWAEITSTPSGLKIASTQQESWMLTHGNIWKHTISSYSALSRLNSSLIKDDATPESKLQLLADENAALDESSNSGQTVPPAPERRPEKVTYADRRVEGVARFSQYGGNPFKERERSYSIEFLESAVYDAAADLNYLQSMGAINDAQCSAIALIEGALLHGRFKGQDVGINLKNALYSWQPLMRVNAIEPDGTQRQFCFDDAHWYLGAERAMVNFGCIWLGDVGGNAPYIRAESLKAVGTGRIRISSAPDTALLWDSMTSQQWEGMSSKQWAEVL